MNIGIESIGVYLPQSRLRRDAIASAHAWAVPSLRAAATGCNAVASWDEDAVTMAHEAARAWRASNSIGALTLCSTSFPFADRSHATLLAESLRLEDSIRVRDVAASRRAATSALIDAFDHQHSGHLVIASERQRSQPASAQELQAGDAAVAIETAAEGALAQYLAGASVNADFVDRYRSSDAAFSYTFEDRWIRDESLLKLGPQAIERVLKKADVDGSQVSRLVGNFPPRIASRIAAAAGLSGAATEGTVFERVGESAGAASLLGLAEALENAAEGELILCLAVAQGADALLLRAGPAAGRGTAYADAVGAGVEDDNYLRFLSGRNLIAMDWGKRAERDVRTAQSAFYRERRQVSAFVGGRCPVCGTVQFPRSQVCVNPDCRAFGEQEDYDFADKPGRIKSFTEDWQAFSPTPPLVYGNVEFDGGANVLMQFADTAPGIAAVGGELTMHLRIKDFDHQRSFRRYFWKAIPVRTH